MIAKKQKKSMLTHKIFFNIKFRKISFTSHFYLYFFELMLEEIYCWIRSKKKSNKDVYCIYMRVYIKDQK